MDSKLKIGRLLVVILGLSLITAPATQAALVTGTWTNAVGQGNGPITNQNTASPTVGDGTSNSAAGEMIDSPFPAITLSSWGQKIVFTGSVVLTGTVNSAATSATPRTQFRFGLFDANADPNDLGWPGYYMSNKHGNPGTPAGVLGEKIAVNTTVYLSATGHTVLNSVQGDGTASSLFHDATYAMNLTMERNATNGLLVSATLTGSNGFSQSLSATDATPSTFTFDSLGFLSGANLGTDRAQFENLDVTFYGVPEATSCAIWLVSLAFGSAVFRRFVI